jgi:DNA polymerase-3 subunit alpha
MFFMRDIVHLRVHSSYTLSEGASDIPSLLGRVKEMGSPALAITDVNNLYGALDFSLKAKDKGIQPIIGCQFYMEANNKNYSFQLLCKDEEGYQNLCSLLKSAYLPVKNENGEMVAPDFPVIDPSYLSEHSNGLIMLTGGGKDGLLPNLAKLDNNDAQLMYYWLLSVFGDNLYVEICRNGLPNEAGSFYEKKLLDLAYGKEGEIECFDGKKRSQAPIVATTDIWYDKEERHDSWVFLNAIENKKTILTNEGSIVDKNPARYHMRTPEEMEDLFYDLPEALENTINIAKRSYFIVPGRNPILPPFPCREGYNEVTELRSQSREGLEKRLTKLDLPKEEWAKYYERLEYELGVIEKMEFPGYFLIVSDFINWAKDQDIPVGPGRGSGVGSVVAWALRIVDLNPLDYNLLFERFLNPERVSMPDFDIDFCQDRRVEVIEYIKQKYGQDKVAMITTFNSIKSKMALTDMQRVLIDDTYGTVSFGEVKDLTKMIPKQDEGAEPKSLQDAYDTVDIFREKVESSDKMRNIFNQALKIEGLLRTSGTHAAGIIISDRPTEELVPTVWDKENNMPVTGFDMKKSEMSGLVKFDFLGLKTLSVIKRTVDHIKKFRKIDLEIADIPKDDPEVMKLYSDGFTTGLFQFESPGMKGLLKKSNPTRLEDLIAANSLYRPGPADYINSYILRKKGLEEVEYPYPEDKTKEFLEETVGIMIYQEQVMQVLQVCAGYSLGNADILRRAMGKKIPEEMRKHRTIFIHGDKESNIPGAVALGMNEKVADRLYDDIAQFAGYGFNKSHAAAYSWISYQTAYLKRYYPAEFLSALMTYEIGFAKGPERMAMIKDDMDSWKPNKIPLLGPDINHSYDQFMPEESEKGFDGYAVRFGLGAIKGIPKNLKEFLSEREKNGPFISLENFYKRSGGFFNKGQMERLAECGAFDKLSLNRRQALSILQYLTEENSKFKSSSKKTKKIIEQVSMFDVIIDEPEDKIIDIPKDVMETPEWGDRTEREYKSVGFYFSNHPIEPYNPRLKEAGVKRKFRLFNHMIENSIAELSKLKICVMVDDVKLQQSKRGNSYLDVFVSEPHDKYKVSFFEDKRNGITLNSLRDTLEGSKITKKPVVIMVDLTLSQDGENVWINGKNVYDIDKYLENIRGNILITLDKKNIRFTKEEGNNFRSIKNDIEEGRVSKQEGNKIVEDILENAIERKITEVSALLEKLGSEQEGKENHLINVTLRIDESDYVLSRGYIFNSQLEAVLKSTDGIISIQETIKKEETKNKLMAL